MAAIANLTRTELNAKNEAWGKDFVREQCRSFSDLELRRKVFWAEKRASNPEGLAEDIKFSALNFGQKSPHRIELETMREYLENRDTLVTI